ncbi:MAG: hypothetical protein ACLTS6_06495 [Anaerobutyricum sp.]
MELNSGNLSCGAGTDPDVVCGRKLTCYPALALRKLAGGNYIEVAPDEAVVDCNLITSSYGYVKYGT